MQSIIDPKAVEWMAQHLQAIGWPTIVWIAWRFSRFLTKLEDRFLNNETLLIKINDSDLPEMKKSLASIDTGIELLRSDLQRRAVQ